MEEKKATMSDRVLEVLEKHPDGINDTDFDKFLPLPKEAKVEIINNLLAERRVILLETKGGEILYKYQSKEKADKYKELTSAEIPIYQLLEDASNRGLSTREIKDKTGITTARVNKLLGSMENKGMIKFIKSIQAKKKKVYMLSEIEPSIDITGGIWYNETEFNTNLIDTLSERCLEYIEKQKTASRKEITLYIRSLRILPSDIKEEEMQSILNILFFDDKIEIARTATSGTEEAISSASGGKIMVNNVYKIKKKYIPDMAILKIPCTYCPVIKECHPDGIISPQTCEYFKDWLGEDKSH